MNDLKPKEGPEKLVSVGDVKTDERSGKDGDATVQEGFLSKAERPYAGDLKGRIEDAKRDPVDLAFNKAAEAEEDRVVAANKAKYSQHGNVGFSGNYEVEPLVER